MFFNLRNVEVTPPANGERINARTNNLQFFHTESEIKIFGKKEIFFFNIYYDCIYLFMCVKLYSKELNIIIQLYWRLKTKLPKSVVFLMMVQTF